MKKTIFFILLLSTIFILNSCIFFEKDYLITKSIPDGHFNRYIEFSEDIKEIKGVRAEGFISISINSSVKSNLFYISHNVDLSDFDYLEIEYETKRGKVKKENIIIKSPDLHKLIYIGADNNLNNLAVKDIQEIESVLKGYRGKNILITLVVDFENDQDSIYNLYNFDGIFYKSINFPFEYGFSNEIDSGKKDVFEKYVNEFFEPSVIRNPDVDLYLELWSHALAWVREKAINDDYYPSSVIDDNSSGKELSIRQITDVLESFNDIYNKKIDILSFSTCNMSYIEIIYQFSSFINYFVGSVEPMPGEGIKYNFIKYYDQGIEKMLEILVDDYEEEYNKVSFATLMALKTEGLVEYINEIIENENYIEKKENYEIKYEFLGVKNLDIGEFLSSNSNFKENFIINSFVRKTEDKTSEESINYLGIGMSYEISLSRINDYKELQFYKDFEDWINNSWKPF
jgi:hypothetical protein